MFGLNEIKANNVAAIRQAAINAADIGAMDHLNKILAANPDIFGTLESEDLRDICHLHRSILTE